MIYFTTLSFDGIMISYLKTELMFSDGFIAAMRALSVVTGLIGTLVMPRLGARMGLVRAGAWSIWYVRLSLRQSCFLITIPKGSRSFVLFPSSYPCILPGSTVLSAHVFCLVAWPFHV